MRRIKEPRALLPNTGGERGVVLVTSLLVIAVLLPLGAIFLSTSITENTISANQSSATRAFQLAEAGIEHGKQALSLLDPSDVLDGTTGIFGFGKGKAINDANLASGNYTVLLANNTAANGFPRGTIGTDTAVGACIPSGTKDCDRIVVLSSTGSDQGSQRTVEMIMQVPGRAPGAIYMMDGPDPGSPAEVEDLEPPLFGATVDGNDCNPPSAGGGPGPGPNMPGIAVQSAAGLGAVIADIGAGNPLVTGVNGNSDVQVDATALNDDEFQAWVQTLIAQSTPFGTGACGGAGNPLQYGTPASPQICWGTGNMTTEIPDGSSGAGILVFNDLTPVGLVMGAEVTNFTYEGIIVVLGDGRFRMFGTSRIYGTVIQKNLTGTHSGETRLRLRDDSRICYSSVAVQSVQQDLTPARLAWYERAQ